MPEVQGVGRPRAIGWQRAAPGTSLRPWPQSSATAAGSAGEWPRGNYGQSPGDPGTGPAPRPAPRPAPTFGRSKNLELRRPAGTLRPTGSALGMLGTQLGLSAREEEPPSREGDSPVDPLSVPTHS